MEMKPYRRLASGLAGLLIAGAFFTTFALAHDESEDAPVILSPTDGAAVRGPVTVTVGFNDASGAMRTRVRSPRRMRQRCAPARAPCQDGVPSKILRRTRRPTFGTESRAGWYDA